MNSMHQKSRHVALIRALGYTFALWIAFVSPQCNAAKILVLGDSLSAGYGISQEDAWPRLLERRLQNETKFAQKNHQVVNASISGETSAGGLNRLSTLLDQHRPNIVIVELGANDGLRGLSLIAMRNNLSAILELSNKKGARTLLVGMQLPPNYGPYAKKFQQSYFDLAKQTKTQFLPFLLEGLTQNPGHFQSDGLHPTRQAQTILLENIWPYLEPLL